MSSGTADLSSFSESLVTRDLRGEGGGEVKSPAPLPCVIKDSGHVGQAHGKKVTLFFLEKGHGLERKQVSCYSLNC